MKNCDRGTENYKSVAGMLVKSELNKILSLYELISLEFVLVNYSFRSISLWLLSSAQLVDIYFAPRSCHVDRLIFHLSLPNLKNSQSLYSLADILLSEATLLCL